MSKKLGVFLMFIGFIIWLVGVIGCFVMGEAVSLDTGMFSFAMRPGAVFEFIGILIFAYNKIFSLGE